jgi:hypothetical protein
MKAIFQFVGHVAMAMVKGFVFTGIVAALVTFGVLFFSSPGHHLSMDVSALFAAVISVLAAFLGSAVALIYHLSHLEDVTHAIRTAQARREAERQRVRAK